MSSPPDFNGEESAFQTKQRFRLTQLQAIEKATTIERVLCGSSRVFGRSLCFFSEADSYRRSHAMLPCACLLPLVSRFASSSVADFQLHKSSTKLRSMTFVSGIPCHTSNKFRNGLQLLSQLRRARICVFASSCSHMRSRRQRGAQTLQRLILFLRESIEVSDPEPEPNYDNAST